MLTKLNAQTLPNAAEAVREKLGDSNTYLPSELAEKIGMIRGRTMKTGVIKLDADSQTLTIPATGKLINVRGFDVPPTAGYLVAATWSEGASPSEYWGYSQIGAQTRYTDNTYSVTFSGLTTSVSDGETTFNTKNDSRFFAAGAHYVWTCFDWEDEHPVAVYHIGDIDEDTGAAYPVYLTIIENGDGTYSACLTGTGKTVNYVKEATKPWADYIDKITGIYIGSGVTSLGTYLFSEHINAKHLQFEDSSTITHLGDRCFWRCRFGGEFAFPNLEDTAFARAFAACDRLRGITLSSAVTSLDENAFRQCIDLRTVSGLGNVKSVGNTAFAYTPKLKQADLDSSKVTDMGVSAFHISSAMTGQTAADWSSTTIGANAFAGAYWTQEQLAALRSIQLPNVQLVDAPLDTLLNYGAEAGEDYLFSLDYDGNPRYLELGCDVVGMALLYNLHHGTSHNIGSWWTEVILPADDVIAAEEGLTPIRGGNVPWAEIVDRVAAAQVLKKKDGYPIFANVEVDDPTLPEPNILAAAFNLPQVKEAIRTELVGGNIPFLTFWQSDSFKHAVYIVGADATTDKLIVVDATKFSDDQGRIYKIALEDLISSGEIAHLDVYEKASM